MVPREDGERGATVVLVAASMIMIMGLAALTIDLGNGWRTRRALIPATDSAALAAAQAYVDGENGCGAIDDAYIASNWPDPTTVHTCQLVTVSSDQGYVIVDADTNVETWFAGVIGAGDYRVRSHSAALYGPPDAVTGLRPIGLCFDGSAALQAVVNNPPATNTTIRVDYDKDQPDACGGASVPGNWGVIDFDFGANSNADTKDWIVNGYPGEVVFENHSVTSCTDAHCYEGDTGALAGINNELNQLKNSGIFFTLPVFNYVENPGANAMFHLMGIVRVRLIDYQVNGNPNNRHFLLEVEPGLITGTCCGSGSGAGDNKVIAICAVDPGDYAACTP